MRPLCAYSDQMNTTSAPVVALVLYPGNAAVLSVSLVAQVSALPSKRTMYMS